MNFSVINCKAQEVGVEILLPEVFKDQQDCTHFFII